MVRKAFFSNSGDSARRYPVAGGLWMWHPLAACRDVRPAAHPLFLSRQEKEAKEGDPAVAPFEFPAVLGPGSRCGTRCVSLALHCAQTPTASQIGCKAMAGLAAACPCAPRRDRRELGDGRQRGQDALAADAAQRRAGPGSPSARAEKRSHWCEPAQRSCAGVVLMLAAAV